MTIHISAATHATLKFIEHDSIKVPNISVRHYHTTKITRSSKKVAIIMIKDIQAIL